MLEEKREGFPERLLERGPHEAVNDGVDRGVGVRHAVGPRFDFVRGVVGLVVWVEGLEEGEDLDGTPADGEEEDDHNHHLGHFAPDADGPLRQEVDLRKRGSEYRDFSCIPGAHCMICFLFMIISLKSCHVLVGLPPKNWTYNRRHWFDNKYLKVWQKKP